MSGILERKKFREVNLNDPFFDSLKSDYREFAAWFERKGDEEAYLYYENGFIQGFLYFKVESGPITDVEPVITGRHLLKIGTLKINPHGTRLGERFIKKAVDYAIVMGVEQCYVTVFEKHKALVDLFEKYGFSRHGVKVTVNGTELVFVKSLTTFTGDILTDYPLISIKGNNKYILSIYPQYHSVMFPDSILRNENVNILEDVSYTNSIHKIYVTRMKVYPLVRGDILVMYRTKDEGKKAEYSSVVSSICVVEEVRYQTEFENFEAFYSYATKYSVFDRNDLQYWYNRGGCYTIKMTYNAALSKRLIRQKLIEQIGIDRDIYWGFFQITDEQFVRILEEGGVLESIIID
ncbi:N-acetyltransferase [Paenibacillus validus]|uniref:N-acetyltransferase n=1 Tax=Paenibacillus chartarius TaxID=747481 RepID=A0ABV6DMM6_9BACL|nr:N-acetyltransferase [Paenibacillus validus]MED4600014.1 N-acetyltransferase [Paenibacillus validus]MED4605719.1 N-acetyltransferase [Paenibacillus validus]